MKLYQRAADLSEIRELFHATGDFYEIFTKLNSLIHPVLSESSVGKSLGVHCGWHLLRPIKFQYTEQTKKRQN